MKKPKLEGVKNLLFDLGGVIMDIRRENCVKALEQLEVSGIGEMLGVYCQQGAFLQLEEGKITPAEFRDYVRGKSARTLSDEEIDTAFDAFLLGIPVARLHALESLRNHYKIYVLSNTNAIMYNQGIRREFEKDGKHREDYFDGICTSFEEGVAKPDRRIFEAVVRKFGIRPEETLFFDDSQTNLDAAAELGFKTWLVDGSVRGVMDTFFNKQVPDNMPPLAATIGMFDGVHRGHRLVVDNLRQAASARGLKTAVFTFPNHPQLLFHPDCGLRLLTSPEKKASLLAQTGVDYTFFLSFTHELAAMTAREFMTLLHSRYNVRLLAVGYDHRFGRRSDETFADYQRYGEAIDMDVITTPELSGDGHISSSAIRRRLAEGDVKGAASMLGHRYCIAGKVVDGKRNGRLIGFPTANIDLDGMPLLVPPDGVYAVKASVDGATFGGMLNIGTPTVDHATQRTIEVNIFNFDSEIYGKTVNLEFVDRVRDERRMNGLDDLRQQLQLDRKTIENILTQSSEYENH